MKTSFILLVILVVHFHCHLCFLTYPISNDILDEFLSSLQIVELSEEKDLLKHAIPGEECSRECRENDRKVCFFNFTLKSYQVLGG
jgi:hypothetical protein